VLAFPVALLYFLIVEKPVVNMETYRSKQKAKASQSMPIISTEIQILNSSQSQSIDFVPLETDPKLEVV